MLSFLYPRFCSCCLRATTKLATRSTREMGDSTFDALQQQKNNNQSSNSGFSQDVTATAAAAMEAGGNESMHQYNHILDLAQESENIHKNSHPNHSVNTSSNTGVNTLSKNPQVAIYQNKSVPHVKRQAQNRTAQKAFRERRKEYIKQLELRLEEHNTKCKSELDKLRLENQQLKDYILTLQTKLIDADLNSANNRSNNASNNSQIGL